MTNAEILNKAKKLPGKIKIYQPEPGTLYFLCGFDYPDEWVDMIYDAFEGHAKMEIMADCAPTPTNRIR